jgi:molybdate transport system permease protein
MVQLNNYSMDTQALLLTIRLASVTTLMLLMISIPLAGWLAFGRSRLKPLAASLAALPLVLPPTVLGYYLLVALGPTTLLGRELARLLGHPLAFSFSGLVVGSVLYSLPFAVQPLLSGFRSLSPMLIENAAVLGAKPMRIFREIVMPLSRSALLTSAVLSFTHTVGEFGVVLMLGGNIPGVTRTLSIVLYDQTQDFNYAAANRTALLLVGISLATLIVLYTHWFGRKDEVGHV